MQNRNGCGFVVAASRRHGIICPVGECKPQVKHALSGIDTIFLSERERYPKCELGNMAEQKKIAEERGAGGLSTLFVTDLDGTLLGADARISQESAALLRPMLDEGLQLAVATARSPATVVELLRPLGLRTPAVLMTGTMIYDVAHTRCLAATPLARETAAAVCAVLERTGQEALAYSVKGGHLYVYYKEFACDFERSFVSSRIHSPYKTFVQVEHYPEALAGGDTLMFLLALPGAEEARAFYDIFSAIPGLICYYYSDEYGSGGCLLEIYPEGCTKASALARVMEMTGARRIVSFGDNINDVPMFRISAESCAVANAVPEARAAATRVIGANTENGVARWLAEHWRDWQ